MGQISDYGSSLARFIAEVTAAALGEEWDAVDVAMQAMMKTGNFERMLGFESPSLFQGRKAGLMALGSPNSPSRAWGGCRWA